ncbi:hypothetical protein [Vulgatibacter sp.]|uniref:hypothetical protein n=1 Tax=Vulgatibacter sp. TaxID=1971226 RepID=UPI00356454E0
MSKRIVIGIAAIGALLLQGCAVGATVTRPRLPTIVIGEAEPLPPPAPMPPPPPPQRRPLPPPPPPQPLSRGEAVAIGQQWCHANGLGCWLDEAKFKRGHGIWRLEFDASTPGHPGHGHGRGKGHHKKKGRGHWKHDHGRDFEVRMDVDAWSGQLLAVRTDD